MFWGILLKLITILQFFAFTHLHMRALEEKKKLGEFEGVWVGESLWKAFDQFPDGGGQEASLSIL